MKSLIAKLANPKLARRSTVAVATVLLSGVLAGAVIAAGALVFPQRSADHLRWGVSQYWAGPAGELNAPRYSNPTAIDMIVATLFYNIVLIDGETDLADPGTEQYQGCMVVELTPHASIYVDDVEDFIDVDTPPYYTEVIASPRNVQRVDSGSWYAIFSRNLDKVGILSSGGTKLAPTMPVHPDLFNLPSNDVVAGQAEAANDCICQGLEDLNASQIVFSDFGVTCDFDD